MPLLYNHVTAAHLMFILLVYKNGDNIIEIIINIVLVKYVEANTILHEYVSQNNLKNVHYKHHRRQEPGKGGPIDASNRPHQHWQQQHQHHRHQHPRGHTGTSTGAGQTFDLARDARHPRQHLLLELGDWERVADTYVGGPLGRAWQRILREHQNG